ncbi:uncharacterized protein [Musca autumnalis]|uniref:uncharacterized protein n=1 Tax=Musca autumnalis TaxID=221902 RepID=UPI003CF9DB88
MQQLAKALLLVALLCVTAHAKTIALGKDDVTSHLMVMGHSDRKGAGQEAVTATASLHSLAEILDKTVDNSTPSSAVEDWSLVCQQLCGAALGGAVCSPYCKNIPVLPTKVQIENANTLMDSSKQFICPQLCGLQLGDSVCTCTKWTSEHVNSLIKLQGDINVCSIFCDVQHVTLAGCSPCSKKTPASDNSMGTTVVSMTKAGQDVDKIMPLSDVSDVATTTSSTGTTPNWNELCAALCKTGDGGSLCNCDLSPFFA